MENLENRIEENLVIKFLDKLDITYKVTGIESIIIDLPKDTITIYDNSIYLIDKEYDKNKEKRLEGDTKFACNMILITYFKNYSMYNMRNFLCSVQELDIALFTSLKKRSLDEMIGLNDYYYNFLYLSNTDEEIAELYNMSIKKVKAIKKNIRYYIIKKILDI